MKVTTFEDAERWIAAHGASVTRQKVTDGFFVVVTVGRLAARSYARPDPTGKVDAAPATVEAVIELARKMAPEE